MKKLISLFLSFLLLSPIFAECVMITQKDKTYREIINKLSAIGEIQPTEIQMKTEEKPGVKIKENAAGVKTFESEPEYFIDASKSPFAGKVITGGYGEKCILDFEYEFPIGNGDYNIGISGKVSYFELNCAAPSTEVTSNKNISTQNTSGCYLRTFPGYLIGVEETQMLLRLIDLGYQFPIVRGLLAKYKNLPGIKRITGWYEKQTKIENFVKFEDSVKKIRKGIKEEKSFMKVVRNCYKGVDIDECKSALKDLGVDKNDLEKLSVDKLYDILVEKNIIERSVEREAFKNVFDKFKSIFSNSDKLEEILKENEKLKDTLKEVKEFIIKQNFAKEAMSAKGEDPFTLTLRQMYREPKILAVSVRKPTGYHQAATFFTQYFFVGFHPGMYFGNFSKGLIFSGFTGVYINSETSGEFVLKKKDYIDSNSDVGKKAFDYLMNIQRTTGTVADWMLGGLVFNQNWEGVPVAMFAAALPYMMTSSREILVGYSTKAPVLIQNNLRILKPSQQSAEFLLIGIPENLTGMLSFISSKKSELIFEFKDVDPSIIKFPAQLKGIRMCQDVDAAILYAKAVGTWIIEKITTFSAAGWGWVFLYITPNIVSYFVAEHPYVACYYKKSQYFESIGFTKTVSKVESEVTAEIGGAVEGFLSSLKNEMQRKITKNLNYAISYSSIKLSSIKKGVIPVSKCSYFLLTGNAAISNPKNTNPYVAKVQVGDENVTLEINPKESRLSITDKTGTKSFTGDNFKFYFQEKGPTRRYLMIPARIIKYCGDFEVEVSGNVATLKGEEAQKCIEDQFKSLGLIFDSELQNSSLGKLIQGETISTSKEGSIIFENGGAYSLNGCLYIVVKYLAKNLEIKHYKINLGWDGKNLDISFTSTPGASPEEKENVKKLNNLIKKISPIYGIESGKYVIYIAEEGGRKYLYIKNKETGEVSKELLLDVKKEGDYLIFKTDKGEHKVRIYVDKNGIPIVEFDGERSVLQRIFGENGEILYNQTTKSFDVTNTKNVPYDEKFDNGEEVKVTKDGLKMQPNSNTGPIIIQQPSGGIHLDIWDSILVIISVIVLFVILIRNNDT
jgi:hypothetical protein